MTLSERVLLVHISFKTFLYKHSPTSLLTSAESQALAGWLGRYTIVLRYGVLSMLLLQLKETLEGNFFSLTGFL